MQIVIIVPNTNKETQTIKDRWYLMDEQWYKDWYKRGDARYTTTRHEMFSLKQMATMSGDNSESLTKVRWDKKTIRSEADAFKIYQDLCDNFSSVLE